MAGIRHLARRVTRQTRLRLVRKLDNTLLALRRCSPLLPPLHHKLILVLVLLRPYKQPPSEPLGKHPSAPTLLRPHPHNHRLHPAQHLHNPINVVRLGDAKIRPPPRQPPPVHKVGLGIRSRGRGVAGRARRHPGPCSAVAE